MPSVNRVLVSSLLSTVSPEASKLHRQKIIEGAPDPFRRAGALALHDFTIRHPERIAAYFGCELDECGFEYVGNGAESTVWRLNKAEVIKANSNSVILSPVALKERLRITLNRHEVMAQYMGAALVPHSLFIGSHPFARNRAALKMTQPYIEHTDPGLHALNSAMTPQQAVRELRASYPIAAEELQDTIERGRALYAAHRLVPDANGAGNLIVDDAGNLRYIDGPIGPDQRRLQRTILNHFSLLERGLAETA